MKKEPKISINVVAYNQEDLIGETLDSILNQTHKNIEILICDDCSTDKTLDVAYKYQKKHSDIIKILPSENNLGVCGNANKGLQAMSGEYFTIYSGDDLLMPDFFETHLKLLNDNPWAVMSHANAIWFDSDTGKNIREHHLQKIEKTTLEAIERRNIICGPATLVRREYLPDAFREDAGSVLDWMFFAEILNKGEGVYCHRPLIKYRRHKNNLSSNPKMYDYAIKALKLMKKMKLKIYPSINIGFARCYKIKMGNSFKNKEIINGVKDGIMCGLYILKYFFAKLIFYFSKDI